MLIEYSNSIQQSIYAVCAACFFPIVFSIIAKILGGFKLSDNTAPRKFLANTSGMAARANAVQANSFEVLPFYIASIIFSVYMVVPQSTINQLAWTFIIIRLLYAFAYLADKYIMRSILWVLSMACPFLLFKLCLAT